MASTDEYQQQNTMNPNRTISKHFGDQEIKGVMNINGRRVIYLKEGVTRKRYYDWCNSNFIEHINQELISLQRLEDFYKKIVGQDDFEND